MDDLWDGLERIDGEKGTTLYLTLEETELGPPGFYRVFWKDIEPILKPHGHGIVRNVHTLLNNTRLLADIEAKSEGRCWYCGCDVTMSTGLSNPQGRELDHRIPWSRGGSNRVKNLVVSCRRCNNTAHPGKGARTVQAYRTWLQDTFYPGQKVVFWGDVCGHTIKLKNGEKDPKQFFGSFWFLTRPEAALHVFSRAQVAALMRDHMPLMLSVQQKHSVVAFDEARLKHLIRKIEKAEPTDSSAFLSALP